MRCWPLCSAQLTAGSVGVAQFESNDFESNEEVDQMRALLEHDMAAWAKHDPNGGWAVSRAYNHLIGMVSPSASRARFCVLKFHLLGFNALLGMKKFRCDDHQRRHALRVAPGTDCTTRLAPLRPSEYEEFVRRARRDGREH